MKLSKILITTMELRVVSQVNQLKFLIAMYARELIVNVLIYPHTLILLFVT